MKKLLLLLAWPVLALAGPSEDYATQWPIRTDAEAGAYRVMLEDAVYQRLRSPTLKDVDIIDARAQPVPVALLAPAVSAPVADWVDVPWFPLPAQPAGADVSAISEIATDGSLRRVELRGDSGAHDGSAGFLFDTSQSHGVLRSLQLNWKPGQAPFERAYEVLASDDLKHWERIEDEAQLVELNNNGQQVRRDRISLPAIKARYLRLVPVRAETSPLVLLSVRAEVVSAHTDETDWRWRTLSARRVDDSDGRRHFEFELEGRFPILRVDVELPGNNSQEWRLEVRDTTEAPWQPVAGPWVAYRLQGAQGSDVSAPETLSSLHRERYWRLTSTQPLGDARPQLRLGYRPEVLMFVAQGQGPYALVAGSARAQRADDAAVHHVLATLREQRGAGWQPPMSTLDAPRELAGDAAFTPAETPRDWKTWLLWGLLIAGALMVGGFAMSLLRKPAA